MTDFIEKKVAEFDEEFAPPLMPAEYHAYGMNGASHPVIENAKDFLRTALEEALLKGEKFGEVNERGFWLMAITHLSSARRTSVLNTVAALKKEVMEGTEQVWKSTRL